MLLSKAQILVTDDESSIRAVLAAQLTRDGYEVHTAADGQDALEILAEHHIDLIITDLKMPRVDGMELLRRALTMDPHQLIIMLTAHGTIDNAVEALKSGAFDYVTKPFDQDELRTIVSKALRTRELAQAEPDLSSIAPCASSDLGIVGACLAVQLINELLIRVANTPTTVLIEGESGTGKEQVALAIHQHSDRCDRPFIRVNCAAVSNDLIDAELFGHERGMFAGGTHAKPGRFELAAEGTLFLDEVGEIPLETQAKLLHALQRRQFERVGGLSTRALQARLIVSTTRDLKKEVAAGSFLQELFYELNVVPMRLPALRERREDLPLLCEHFIAQLNQRLNRCVQGVTPEALRVLEQHDWPGNVRELENVIERAVLFCDSRYLDICHLSPDVWSRQDVPSERLVQGAKSSLHEVFVRSHTDPVPESTRAAMRSYEGLKQQVRAARAVIERELILSALQQTGDNVTHAARMLKISRKSLQLKMKELGLRDRDEKDSA